MPPRKSTDSVKSVKVPNGTEDGTPGKTSKEEPGFSVEDLSLARSMIQRLAKGVLPPNTQIQKDALLAMSKSATVFVNYLASYANERAINAGKRTIQPKDVLEALTELELEGFLPRCETELEKYNAIQCDKRNTYRRKVRDEKRAAGPSANDTTLSSDSVISSHPTTNGHTNGDRDVEPPAAKKPRTSSPNGIHVEHAEDEADNDTIDEDEGDDLQPEDEEDEVESDDDAEESEIEEVVQVAPAEEHFGTDDRNHNLHDDDEGSESD